MSLTKAIIVMLACAWFAAWCADGPPKSADAAHYTLGPNDQITVEVVELPEFAAKSYRIDADGAVSLPLIGRVPAMGLTVAQFQEVLEAKLHTQVRNPHVTTGVMEVRSQPVSVMGSVNTPGTQMLQGPKTLFDVLAMAGGLKTDAGDTIKVTRQKDQGPLNLPEAVTDPSSGSTTAEVNVRDVVDLQNPGANIAVRPYDAVAVPRAKIVYVIGNVRKAGGFTISQNHKVSALEALSLAEGLTPNAAPQHARIARVTPDGSPTRQQIPVDLKKILAGKAEDLTLRPDDILYIPDSSTRRTTGRLAEAALATVSGLIIWRGF